MDASFRWHDGEVGAGAECLRLKFRLQQAVEVDHHIFHLGIVDGALGVGAPGVEAVSTGKKTDQGQ